MVRKEVTGIILFLIVILITISLLTYHPADPSINNSVLSAKVHNTLGIFGAQLSGLLFGLFGAGALWIPLLICYGGMAQIKKNAVAAPIWPSLVSGSIILILSTGGLLDGAGWAGEQFTGPSLVAGSLRAFLKHYTNITGANLILLGGLLSGFVLATGVSLITLAQYLRRRLKSDGISSAGKLKKWRAGRALKKEAAAQTIDIPVIADNPKPEKKKKPKPLKKVKQSKPTEMPDDDLIQPEPTESLEPDFSSDKIDGPPPVYKDSAGDDVTIKDMRPKPVKAISPAKQEVFGFMHDGTPFRLPAISLLSDIEHDHDAVDTEFLKTQSRLLEEKLNDFGVEGKVVTVSPGPVITTFEYKPAPGVKISKVVNLADDLALALRALSIRIIAPIPGKAAIGVEVPNDTREMVGFKEIVVSNSFQKLKSKLSMCLGKDIVGNPVAVEMDKMPHLLIAGATGAGKSVGLNVMITSLLYKATPDEVKMIMIDPKRIELSMYDGIPHLITPVVTDMKLATNALFWAVREMEGRYELLAEHKVRNIAQYNKKAEIFIQEKEQAEKKGKSADTESGDGEPVAEMKKLPYIVIIIDELADLMMVSSKDVEVALARLAQMARAAGIHIVLATQRPSVDVLTGMIKANFPTRIAFQVSSKIDSRTIIDSNGAENLLGSGDMLFVPPGTAKLMRIHGAYISEDELTRVIDYLKEQQEPSYLEDVLSGGAEESTPGELSKEDYDEKYDEAVALVAKQKQASISMVQRHLRIGYNRAARIIEVMEQDGIIGPADGAKAREVLITAYDGAGGGAPVEE